MYSGMVVAKQSLSVVFRFKFYIGKQNIQKATYMKSVEIITLQSAAKVMKSIRGEFRALMTDINQRHDSIRVTLYRRSALATDLSFHIHQESKEGEVKESVLGLRLASALGEFGRVSHSVWTEMET